MTTAIIITGAMRSADKCLPNLHWFVFRHFPDAKFYIATHDDADAHKTKLYEEKYPGRVTVKLLTQPEMIAPPGCPTVWNGAGQPYMHEPYAISVPPAAVLGQLWTLRQGWALFEEAGEPEPTLVIRCRPDLWFHSFVGRHWPARSQTYDGVVRQEYLAFAPWWGRFGGVNDRFAWLGAEAAKAYFTTYDAIPDLVKRGCPLHPESLVAAALRDGHAHVEDFLQAEFSTLRTDGHFRGPEISAIDMAHARARG